MESVLELELELEQVREEAARKDTERLQGVWNFVSGKREAELLIAADHFTMRFRNGDLYVGRFTVNPTHKPAAMDLFIDEGPEPYRGKVSRAIYGFDTDHLIWCPSAPGHDRMRAFPPEEDHDHLCIIFRRQKNRR